MSKPNESERDFRVRLTQAAREKRDQQAEQLRQKFAPKIAAIDERIRKAPAIGREEKQASNYVEADGAAQHWHVDSVGVSGPQGASVTNVGRVTTSVSKASKSMKDSQDASMAEENVDALKSQKEAIEAQFKDEVAKLEIKVDPQAARSRGSADTAQENEHQRPRLGPRLGPLVEDERRQDDDALEITTPQTPFRRQAGGGCDKTPRGEFEPS